MASLRLQAISRAHELGAIVHEVQGRFYEFNVEAPTGYCWEEQCHEYVNNTRSGERPSAEFWNDVLSRMERAPQLCETPDCDWCADRRRNSNPLVPLTYTLGE